MPQDDARFSPWQDIAYVDDDFPIGPRLGCWESCDTFRLIRAVEHKPRPCADGKIIRVPVGNVTTGNTRVSYYASIWGDASYGIALVVTYSTERVQSGTVGMYSIVREVLFLKDGGRWVEVDPNDMRLDRFRAFYALRYGC